MNTMPKPRAYYGARTRADATKPVLDLDDFKDLFIATHKQLSSLGYWDEALGFSCVDSTTGFAGTVGSDVSNYVLMCTHKTLWPIDFFTTLGWSEADVFTMIEFLFDHISRPVRGYFHDHGNCGMHWEEFDRASGQEEFRARMCELLEIYGPGYFLNDRGEIMELAPKGMRNLLSAKPPTSDEALRGRINRAIDRFQRYRSSTDDRRHAVRDLADVLEKLRPKMKDVLNRKDESDLFNIANNFGIRHNDEKQKTEYDPAVWLSWMFYYYLATINACLHFLDRHEKITASA
jgi:hypothetical protein